MNMLFIVLQLIFIPLASGAWEVALATMGQIDFFNANGNILEKITEPSADLQAMEFDSINQRLFLSDDTNSNYSIFTLNLQGNQELTPFIKRADNHKVLDIAYDFVSDALYWTGETDVYWFTSKMKNKEGQILHKLGSDDAPHGIAIDSCRRYVYWTNSYHLSPTIEKSLLDGSQREIVMDKGLFQPMGIAVDVVGAKIYWSDDQPGIYYNIRRANLDGSHPETIKHGTHHEPFYLAITGNDIFWSDLVSMAVWKMPKEATKGEQPTKFYQCIDNRTPQGIVAWHNGKLEECPTEKTITAVYPKIRNSEENFMSDGPRVTAESEQLKEMPGTAGYCLNSGVVLTKMRNTRGSCHCLQGYTGERCEISLCHNYCLNDGTCEIDTNGALVCRCLDGFKGPRCEQNVCINFCLNGANCVVDKKERPCKCSGQFTGVRCEIAVSERVCHSYCQQFGQLYVPIDGEATQMCLCPSMMSTNEYNLVPLQNSSSPGIPLMSAELNQSCLNDKLISDWVSVALGIACFILVIAVFILLRRVFLLQKRPRIKKRIIVKKNVTPLTSRPSLPSEQCEITIENCCNMNICETPCFEPQLRTPKSSRTEEKKTLLGSMEEAPTSSPCQEHLY